MSRWFRVDDGLVDDPKVQRLPDKLFRAVINIWCITSQSGGNLPPVDQIAFKLRITSARAEAILSELREAGLIDDDEAGSRPHNWNGRQFKSDVSTERVQAFRERQRNVSSTVSETPPYTETETETETEKKDIRAVAVATRPADFDEIWKIYPKRDGANPKAPARKKYAAAVKSGVSHEAIRSAVNRYRAECQAKQIIGTTFVAQAMTWFGQRRWEDYAPTVDRNSSIGQPPPGAPTEEELRKKYGKRDATSNGATPEISDDSAAGGADHPREFLSSGTDVHPREMRAGQSSGCAPRHAGMRSLGEILPDALTLGAMDADRAGDGGNRVDDTPDAISRVVRH